MQHLLEGLCKYENQSIENQLDHGNGKCISRTQTKRDPTIEDTGSTVTQGTSNQDKGNTDDDEEDWVVITYPKRNTRQVICEDISPTSVVTHDDISPAPVEELQEPPTSTTEILQDNPQLLAKHDSSPMSRYEKHGQVLKSVTIQWTWNTNQVLYKLQCWKDTCEQEGSRTGYLIINGNY